jgi:hypothetical protein
MTWHYGIRRWRIVEVYEGIEATEPGHIGQPYAILGWRDVPQILRDIRWVIQGIRYERSKRASA